MRCSTRFETTKSLVIRFRAMLTDSGAERLELAKP
jgi:hypothetical protein